MKLLKKSILIALLSIPTLGLACSGHWYTCGNLESFFIQVSQNCSGSGSMTITDCDAGTFNFTYSLAP